MKPSKSDKKSGVRASRFACCLMAIAMVFFGVPLGVAETPPVPAKPPAKLSAFPAPNLAQPQSPKGFEAGMEKTIFLDLRDINVIDVFKFIAAICTCDGGLYSALVWMASELRDARCNCDGNPVFIRFWMS